MSGKSALITGANSDVGRAVAARLAACGFNIAAHYYSNLEAVRRVESEARENRVQCGSFRYNLIEANQAQEMINAVMKEFGSIDVLINTMGPFTPKDILEVTPKEWAECINLNLQSAFNVTYSARNHICATKGHIINFGYSGVEQLRAWRTGTAYSAAKAGVIVLTKSLAAGLASQGVRVNAICPGLLEASTLTEKQRREMSRMVPFGRLGRPDEIAEVVRWLIIDSPPYLTGALIPVAGAWEQ